MGRSALIVFICAGTAGAQGFPRNQASPLFCSQANSTVPARGEGLVPAVALMPCRQPQYTEEARIAHLAGIVTMSLTIDDDGIPSGIHVVNPVGLGLDESAVTCIHQARYSPAQKDGKPVPSKINVSLPFQEHWDSDWHLGAAVFHVADGTARPVVMKAKFPRSTSDHRSLTVCVHLTVGKDGSPHDVQVATAQDSRLDKDAMAIMGALVFRPGMRNREPVDVPATLTLVHGIANGAIARKR